MHLDPSTPRRLAQAGKTFARLDRILAGERPDLVVFTGDVVTGAPAETMSPKRCGAACSTRWNAAGFPIARCWATTTPSRTSRAPRSDVSPRPAHIRSTRPASPANCPTSNWRCWAAGAPALRRLLPRFARRIADGGHRRLRLVPAGADCLAANPLRSLHGGQRRPSDARAGVFPYRTARIRRGMAEPPTIRRIVAAPPRTNAPGR